jgi:pyruvate/2-oxoglutarate dehydrogenase complex dihydrolipoamide acyltransferase (E2) component
MNKTSPVSTAEQATAPATESASQTASRRGFVAATAAVGSLAAAATLWVSRKPALQTPQALESDKPDTTAAGYRLTEHVKRYYQTTTL